jgi:hypothetical protein
MRRRQLSRMKDDECGRRREQHRALRGKAAIPLDEPMISRLRWEVNTTERLVMSSRLCKKVKGAVFPFQVESLEDSDAVHTFYIHNAHHGPGSPPQIKGSLTRPCRLKTLPELL